MKNRIIASYSRSCFTVATLAALLFGGSANFASAQRVLLEFSYDDGRAREMATLFAPFLPTVVTDSNWTGANGNWSSNGNPGWNGSGVPNAIGAVANFGATVTGTTTQNVGGGVTVGTISLTNISNFSRTITNTNGITMNQDGAGAGFATISNNTQAAGASTGVLAINTGTLTLADDLLISATGGFNVSGGAIQITAAIAGTGNVTFDNAYENDTDQAGSIRLQDGVNTFVGSVLVGRGAVTYNLPSAFGSSGNAVTLGQAGSAGAALLSTTAVGIPNNITVANTGIAAQLTLGSLSTAAIGGTYSGNITLNGDVYLRSNNTSATDGLKFSGAITGVGAIHTFGPGSWAFSGAGVNTYSGGTYVESNGLLAVLKDHGLGTGDVFVSGGGTPFSLILQGGTLNDYISDNATLYLLAANAMVNLDYFGTDVIGGLSLSGGPQTDPGTYGSTASGAMHVFDNFFTGTGTLTLIPEPSTWAMTIMGAGLVMTVQRFRRKKS